MRFFALAALAASAIAVQTRVEDKSFCVPGLADRIVAQLDTNGDNVITTAEVNADLTRLGASEVQKSAIHHMAKKMYPTEYKAAEFKPEQVLKVLQMLVKMACKKWGLLAES